MLKLRNISKYYHSNDVVALGLRKVNLDFKLGEFVAVTGESGSGKSTLLNVISGLDTYEDGEMYVGGEETSYFEVEEWENYRRQYIGFVFQSYNIIDSYSVLENVVVALQIQGYDKDKRRERALELIEKVGLSSHVNHKASKLSGGQKQRAVIARALAKDCPIIVCDEPTGNLDSESADRIMTLLAEISKEKLVIVVTHNYDEVKKYATRKIRLFDGEVVEDKKIRKRADVSESVTVANYFMNVFSLIGIALRNLVRTPKRSVFTLIVGLFIALIFMFSYGNYKQGDNGSYYGYNVIFKNIMESRIVVNNFDGSELTDNDLIKLGEIRNVNKVLEHDVVLDSTMFLYQQSGYYDEFGSQEEDENYYERDYYITPASAVSKFNLSSGRLPENATEVVIEQPWGDEYKVGDKVFIGTDYIVRDPSTWQGKIPDSAIEVTVVGLTKSLGGWTERLIFVDEVVEKYENVIRAYTGGNETPIIRFSIDLGNEEIEFENLDEEYMYYKYSQETIKILIDDTLEDNKVKISEELIYSIADKKGIQVTDENQDFFVGEKYDFTSNAGYYTFTNELTVVGRLEDNIKNMYGQIVSMNQNTFNSFIEDKVYQAAVLVDGSFESTKVIKEIEELGFNAIYPAGVANPVEQIQKLISGIGFGILLAFFTFIIWIVTYLVLRNVQKAKQKDYLIFRSIGASKKDLNKVTILELALSMTFSYIIVIVLLVINENFNTFIPQYLRYFNIGGYLMIYMILMLLAYLLSSSFNKRIFSKSVISSLKQE